MQSQVTTFLPSFFGGGSEGCSLLAAFLAEPPSNAEPGDYFFSPFLGVLGVGQEGEEHKVRVGGGWFTAHSLSSRTVQQRRASDYTIDRLFLLPGERKDVV